MYVSQLEPDDKIFALLKWKVFCIQELHCGSNGAFFLGWCSKNIVGEGENAGNQHFLLFPQ